MVPKGRACATHSPHTCRTKTCTEQINRSPRFVHFTATSGFEWCARASHIIHRRPRSQRACGHRRRPVAASIGSVRAVSQVPGQGSAIRGVLRHHGRLGRGSHGMTGAHRNAGLFRMQSKSMSSAARRRSAPTGCSIPTSRRVGVSGKPSACFPCAWILCKSDRSGLSAKCCFHSRGVSSATRAAGCWPTRCRTSTRSVYGSMPCRRQVAIRLYAPPSRSGLRPFIVSAHKPGCCQHPSTSSLLQAVAIHGHSPRTLRYARGERAFILFAGRINNRVDLTGQTAIVP